MCKNIKFLKKAMTLAELLIVFIIMGVVAAMILITAKPLDKSIKFSYNRIYNTLETAYFNAITDIKDIHNGIDAQSDVTSIGFSENTAANWDGEFPLSSSDFCRMLLLYINDKSGDGKANCDANTIDINKSSTDLDAVLNSAVPHFIASNGVKFWIGHTKTAKKHSTFKYTTSSGDNVNIDGYLVITDLNGEMPPNSTNATDNKMADRVCFLVTKDSNIIPLGRPEIDTRYLSVRVVYSQSVGTSSSDFMTSAPISYFEAKRRAWGKEAGADKLERVSSSIFSFCPYKQTGNYGDANENITTGPFYLDYSAQNELNNITYDDEYCVDNSGTFKSDLCSVKITNYY